MAACAATTAAPATPPEYLANEFSLCANLYQLLLPDAAFAELATRSIDVNPLRR